MGVLRILMSSRVISQIISDFRPRHSRKCSIGGRVHSGDLGSTVPEATTPPPNSQR